MPLLSSKRVVQVSCGGYHTLALTETNELYAWGSGLYGECGFGEFLNTSSPKLVLMPWVKKSTEEQTIVEISAGGHHSLVLTEHGYVFSFGFASHGQLGLRNTINQSEPQLVSDLRTKPIQAIAAGWNHTLVLTQRGDVYACGYGSFGQLGLGDDVTFLGPINHDDIGARFERADLFVSMSDTGSLDKSVLEAFVLGLPVMTGNRAFRAMIPPSAFIEPVTAEMLAACIEQCGAQPYDESERMRLSNEVLKHHSLPTLIITLTNALEHVRD